MLFKGSLTGTGKRGVTLRELVDAVFYHVIQAGQLTVGKERHEKHFLRPRP